MLYAKKGFRSDARQHFLAYAERMHRGEQPNEVARSLADYVVLCDGAVDARAGLAAHLAIGAARPAELAGRLAELLEKALQAAGQLEDGGGATGAAGAAHSLVFLDLDPAALDAAEQAPQIPAGASNVTPTGWEVAPADEPLELLDAGTFGGSSVPGSLDDAFLEFGPTDEPTGWGDPGAHAAAPASRLRTLPGELPPLAPSMVALDGGRAGEDWSVAPAVDPAEPHDDASIGVVPAFALDSDGAYDAAAPFELPTGVPAFADEPAAAAFDGHASLADLPLMDDVAGDQPPPTRAAPVLADAAPALDDELLDLDEPVPVPVEPARRAAPAVAAAVAAPAVDDGLDLGAWLRDSEPAPSTRLVAAAMPTTGDEEADFQATLQAFKAGIARSLADADFDAHYDLGVAYKEMGLLEEAIGEFQKAARSPDRPLRALEALAECFLEREEPQLVLSTLAGAAAQLTRAASTAADASQHVALCYLLGAASQDVGRTEEARGWFLRVLATDYAFRDAATRLASLSPPTR